jgi:hypothetical protein
MLIGGTDEQCHGGLRVIGYHGRMAEHASGSSWKGVGCVLAAGVLLLAGCLIGLAGGARLLAEPPPFHNRVYRNDRMLFHNWQLDGMIGDGKGTGVVVDLQREYVLCVVSGSLGVGDSTSYEARGRSYTIGIGGHRSVSGVLTERTIEVVDLTTGKRTTTRMSAGDVYDWKAAMERASRDGEARIDFRAMLVERGIPLP